LEPKHRVSKGIDEGKKSQENSYFSLFLLSLGLVDHLHWEDACCLPQLRFFSSSSFCTVPLRRPHGGRISRKPPNRMKKPSLDPGTAGLDQWEKNVSILSSHAGCEALQVLVAELRVAPGGLSTGHARHLQASFFPM
jgi:hypothetical protein